jgi:mannonate dehydratase
MVRILDILDRNKFDGVIVPDHTPQMTCAAPWHAGMTHTIGFITAVLAIQKKRAAELTLVSTANAQR